MNLKTTQLNETLRSNARPAKPGQLTAQKKRHAAKEHTVQLALHFLRVCVGVEMDNCKPKPRRSSSQLFHGRHAFNERDQFIHSRRIVVHNEASAERPRRPCRPLHGFNVFAQQYSRVDCRS